MADDEWLKRLAEERRRARAAARHREKEAAHTETALQERTRTFGTELVAELSKAIRGWNALLADELLDHVRIDIEEYPTFAVTGGEDQRLVVRIDPDKRVVVAEHYVMTRQPEQKREWTLGVSEKEIVLVPEGGGDRVPLDAAARMILGPFLEGVP